MQIVKAWLILLLLTSLLVLDIMYNYSGRLLNSYPIPINPFGELRLPAIPYVGIVLVLFIDWNVVRQLKNILKLRRSNVGESERTSSSQDATEGDIHDANQLTPKAEQSNIPV